MDLMIFIKVFLSVATLVLCELAWLLAVRARTDYTGRQTERRFVRDDDDEEAGPIIRG